MEEHRLAALIPEMTPEQYEALVEDIGEHGLREPITLYEGRILDGRHRYRAITELAERGHAIEPRYQEFEGTEREAFTYVISLNLHRRHLEFGQRAALAALYKRSLQETGAVKHGQRNDLTPGTGAGSSGDARDTAARAFSVSGRSVSYAEEVLDLAPDLHQQMIDGGIELKPALREARSRQREEERVALMDRAACVPVSDRYRVFRADVETLARHIEPGSVDAIVTDPPYPREYLHLFGSLGELAAHALKPGGSLIVMSGQSYLPEVLSLILPHLRYHWIISALLLGAESPTAPMFSHRVNSYWKPFLMFTNGEYGGERLSDVVQCNDKDKRFHVWGQSELVFAEIIERVTKPNDLILDPFCGGGTTAVAALGLSRRVIATDIDADCVALTLGRLSEVET